MTVPALAWRGGFLRRAATIGLGVGVVLGALAWLDSGLLVTAVIVLVVIAIFYGSWMARRMARFWLGADDLSGADRVAAVRTARRGERLGDVRLAHAVIDYSRGLHAAAESARPFRWVLPVVLVAAIGTAIWDGLYGTWGNFVASVIYLVALPNSSGGPHVSGSCWRMPIRPQSPPKARWRGPNLNSLTHFSKGLDDDHHRIQRAAAK